MPKQKLTTLLSRAARLRCPTCGRGRLFDGWFSPRERCPACGQALERAEDGAVALPFITYPFSKTLWLAIDLYIQPEP